MTNLSYLLRNLKPYQQIALGNILKKLNENRCLTQNDVGLLGCDLKMPAKKIEEAFSDTADEKRYIKKAIATYAVDEDGLVFWPGVFDEYIKIRLREDRPATLFDLVDDE